MDRDSLLIAPRLALSCVLLAVRALPRGWLRGAAAVLTWLTPLIGRKDVRRLRRNVQMVYGLPPLSHFSRLFERQVIRHQVIAGLETLKAIYAPKLVTVVGLDELRANIAAAETAGKGHILVTAHVGSWELCAYYGQHAATRPFYVLAKPSRSRALTTLLESLRQRMGVNVLWTDRKSLLRDMLGALKKGEAVGFVMDQKPEARKGPVVPFLGRPTEFVAGPASMAVRTGCAVISIFCLREGPLRYRLWSRVLAPAGHGETDELNLTRRMAAEIEAVIRAYPEQWTWNYKRWRDDLGTVAAPP